MHTSQVTILMSVYNAERYLAKAILSNLKQSFTDFELIVVEDGSTDDSPQILNSFTDPRIVKIINSENIGLTRSLNKGLAGARGALIARHDADDLSHPERLQQQVALFQKSPAVGLVGTGYEVINRKNQILESVNPPSANCELQAKLEHGNCFCHGSVMIRRSYLEKIGGYREYFCLTQDYDLWLRLAEVCELANVPIPLYQLRFDATTMSRQKRGLQLAYRRLAYTLATQRRTKGVESPLPENVLLAYPPEPERLFADARGTAYLFYLSGEIDKATTSLRRAREIETEIVGQTYSEDLVRRWQAWVLSRALAFMQSQADASQCAIFIDWAFKTLAFKHSTLLARHTTGQFYADRAFNAYQTNVGLHVLIHALRAVRYDPRWIYNRALFSILAKSLGSPLGVMNN